MPTDPAIGVARRDPLRNFQFRLRLLAGPGTEDESDAAPQSYVAGLTRVSGLSLTVSPIEIWSGGNARHRHAHPDKCSWEPITLEQGLAIDGQLFAWAQAAVDFATSGRAPSGVPVKRGVVLDVWDPYATLPPAASGGGRPSGQNAPASPMYRYHIHNAWVSRLEALPQLDAASNEIALLTVELTHEGWQGVSVEPEPEGLGAPSDTSDNPLEQPGGPDLAPSGPVNQANA